jgi:hypothetical protein
MAALVSAVEGLGGRIVHSDEAVVRAEFTTMLMGYTDDLAVLLGRRGTLPPPAKPAPCAWSLPRQSFYCAWRVHRLLRRHLRFRCGSDGLSTVFLQSSSRIGIGDMGANRKRIEKVQTVCAPRKSLQILLAFSRSSLRSPTD